MRTPARRRLDMALLGGAGVVVGVSGLVGAVAGNTEQIDAVWTRAVVNDDGSAEVVEVFDYDFGFSTERHGIERVIPDLPLETPMEVTADAPSDVAVSAVAAGTNFRIGDPNRTVSGKHRYELTYPLPSIVRDNTLDWDTVGYQWEVDMHEVEAHVVAPFELDDVRCVTGGIRSPEACPDGALRVVEPGHLVVRLDSLSAGNGLSIEATAGGDLAATPTVPQPPTERPADDGTGLLPPFAVALGGALVGAAPASRLVRRAGRERIASGGAADVAYAGRPPFAPPLVPPASVGHIGEPVSGPPEWLPPGERRIDEAELAGLATIEFAPPAELRPAQGGVVLRETVQQEHKVAWLVQAAIEGAVHIEEDGDHDPTALVRTGPGTAATAPLLDVMFDGRERIELGTYDERFGRGFGEVGQELESWRASSGLWDARADRRRVLVRVLGGVAFVVGGLAVFLGGLLANMSGPAFLALVLAGAVVAGAGAAGVIRGWELRVRTATGSGLWLRVESFRWFLAGSEAHHAEEAARRGVLREYTAWAIALGEIDRWSQAVRAASATIPYDAGLSYAYLGPALLASSISTASAPSSGGSGGGGFGGGSVGGGAGGGGGGSW
ncbi:MAG TPA: DUF2207 domain-containing protein [Acidimicrobiales bacterium]|nr:DUF2207 domain-containing protein [Acidimicrobiales bacterium]